MSRSSPENSSLQACRVADNRDNQERLVSASVSRLSSYFSSISLFSVSNLIISDAFTFSFTFAQWLFIFTFTFALENYRGALKARVCQKWCRTRPLFICPMPMPLPFFYCLLFLGHSHFPSSLILILGFRESEIYWWGNSGQSVRERGCRARPLSLRPLSVQLRGAHHQQPCHNPFTTTL